MSLRGGGKWKNLVQRLLELGYITKELSTLMINDLRTLTAQGIKKTHGFEEKKESVIKWLKFHKDQIKPEERTILKEVIIPNIREADDNRIEWRLEDVIPDTTYRERITRNPLIYATAFARSEEKKSGLGKPKRCKKCGLLK